MSAQLAAAVVAAGSALLAAVMSTWTVTLQRRRSAKAAEIDFLRRQLNDLYGPIYMRLWTTFKLRALLPTVNEDGTPWILGGHIEQTQAGPDTSLKDAFKEMLAIGEETEQILIGKSGLFIAFPPPPSYGQLIAYSRLLRLAWQNGKNQSEPGRVPFPDDFPYDITDAIRQIRSRLVELGAMPPGTKSATDLGDAFLLAPQLPQPGAGTSHTVT
jgi:hypothetical protein